MIQSLINQIRAQQEGLDTPLQCLWTHGTDEDGPIVPDVPTAVDWPATIPAHRNEGLTGLPAELPFALAVDEYASQSGRGYVIRIRARVNGEVVEMTDQDGPLIWTQQSFRVEMRPKLFTGQWSGWGWRAEVIGREGPDMGVRSLAFYSDPEHQSFLYTIGGAFTQQPSEYHPGQTVWAAETPEGQRTAERQAIHWAALYASIQEVKGTIGLDDDLSIGRYFIGLEGAQELPPPDSELPDRWNQPGAPAPGGGVYPAYAQDINWGGTEPVMVVWDRPQDDGQDWVFRSKIANNTTEPSRDATFDRWWEPVSRSSEYQP